MPTFIPGLQLSELFYREAVRPILAARFPALRYSAALIGYGSEVLGYDDPRSTDHHWGPRVLLFLDEEELERERGRISAVLSEALPPTIAGYPTNFGPPDAIGVRLLEAIASGPVNHMVELYAVRPFFRRRLGLDPDAGLRATDWLTVPQQRLLEVTAGVVFHDGLEQLGPLREKFAYYPRDVWLYLLAAGWTRVSQEEAFVGRCGETGDELGSRLVAARLVRDLMQLCFLMARRYAPYTKWFGTAFARLPAAERLRPIFEQVLRADHWREREAQLARAYEIVAALHNALEITAPLDTVPSPYYGRPFLVIHAGRFAAAIREVIEDEEVRGIGTNIGAVDQFVDSTDALTHPNLLRTLAALYT